MAVGQPDLGSELIFQRGSPDNLMRPINPTGPECFRRHTRELATSRPPSNPSWSQTPESSARLRWTLKNWEAKLEIKLLCSNKEWCVLCTCGQHFIPGIRYLFSFPHDRILMELQGDITSRWIEALCSHNGSSQNVYCRRSRLQPTWP